MIQPIDIDPRIDFKFCTLVRHGYDLALGLQTVH